MYEEEITMKRSDHLKKIFVQTSPIAPNKKLENPKSRAKAIGKHVSPSLGTDFPAVGQKKEQNCQEGV